MSSKENKKISSKKKKTINKALKMEIWKKYIGDAINGNCYVCNRPLQIDMFEAGHLIAESNGGQTIIENMRVVCKPCNQSCYTQNMDEFKRQFNVQPQNKSEEEIRIKIEEEVQKKIKMREEEIRIKIEDEVQKKIKMREEKYNQVKYNSSYRRLIITDDEPEIFEKMCHQIVNNEELYKTWLLHFEAKQGKVMLEKNNSPLGVSIYLEKKY